jgi:flagellin
MSRINSNVSSLIARANLDRSNADLDVRLQRLATGVRINRGADDPAGLIISQRLGSEINGLEQAVKNSERASSVIATAEGSLAEVADLLNSIKGLVVEAANTGALSNEEREANQLQINSAIESITRISNSASFGGLKLLNGELDYVLSGLRTTAISKAQILGAAFNGASSIQVEVQTVASAQRGALYVNGVSSGPFGNGFIQSSVTLEIAGINGVQVIQFLSGRTLAEVRDAVNSFAESTGVQAVLVNNNPLSGLIFRSTAYGSNQFVSVKRLNEPATGNGWATYKLPDTSQVPGSIDIPTSITGGQLVAANRDAGRDVVAVVNGTLGTGTGLRLSLPNVNTLSLDLTLSESLATNNSFSSTFHITGGGALYQLGGSVNTNQQINIGLQSVASTRLGGTLINGTLQFLDSLRSGGSNDLNSRNFQEASSILDSASTEVSVVRGRLGALEKNTLETNTRSLRAAVENLTASQSRIRDADFASETSALSRSQILASAGTSALALSNQRAQNVLQLLGR